MRSHVLVTPSDVGPGEKRQRQLGRRRLERHLGPVEQLIGELVRTVGDEGDHEVGVHLEDQEVLAVGGSGELAAGLLGLIDPTELGE